MGRNLRLLEFMEAWEKSGFDLSVLAEDGKFKRVLNWLWNDRDSFYTHITSDSIVNTKAIIKSIVIDHPGINLLKWIKEVDDQFRIREQSQIVMYGLAERSQQFAKYPRDYLLACTDLREALRFNGERFAEANINFRNSEGKINFISLITERLKKDS